MADMRPVGSPVYATDESPPRMIGSIIFDPDPQGEGNWIVSAENSPIDGKRFPGLGMARAQMREADRSLSA